MHKNYFVLQNNKNVSKYQFRAEYKYYCNI